MRLEDVPFSAVYQATLKSQWLMTKKAPVVFTDGTGSPEAALFQTVDRAHLCCVAPILGSEEMCVCSSPSRKQK